MEWFETVRAALHAAAADSSNPAAKPANLSGDEAARILMSTEPTSAQYSRLSVDSSDPLLAAGWVSAADIVSVTPIDRWKAPQLGRLMGLSAERVSILIQVPKSERTFVGHFPRIGYTIERVKGGNDVYARL